MTIQLHINQGPQDALLYDNKRSYFQNVGYVRTSNFQVEYRNIDAQSDAKFDATATFVVQKAADLLGPVDLIVNLGEADKAATFGLFGSSPDDQALIAQWVDELGYALIFCGQGLQGTRIVRMQSSWRHMYLSLRPWLPHSCEKVIQFCSHH